jgi:hypothetical protein
VAQDEALVVAVADLPGDDQDLAVQVDRLPEASETVIAAPRLPRAAPSVSRSPICREMVRAWVCISIACR